MFVILSAQKEHKFLRVNAVMNGNCKLKQSNDFLHYKTYPLIEPHRRNRIIV